MAELKDTQEIFALTLGVNKTAGTGGLGLHYRDTNAAPPLGPLGLITLKVQGSLVNGGYSDDGTTITYTIGGGGSVKVVWREPKGKNGVTLVCKNMDTVTVNITR